MLRRQNSGLQYLAAIFKSVGSGVYHMVNSNFGMEGYKGYYFNNVMWRLSVWVRIT